MDFFYKTKAVKFSFWRFFVTLFCLVFSVYCYGFLLSFFIRHLSEDSKIFCAMFSFVLAFFVLLFCLHTIHKQSILHIFTSHKKIHWKGFFIAFFISSIFIFLQFLFRYFLEPESYFWHFQAASFFKILLPIVLLLPFQTSFEEVFFRGFLLRFFRWKGYGIFTSILLSSCFFGLLHFANPEVEKMGFWAVLYYILWGIFFAILTVKSGGLELSLGIHAAHNIFSCILITSDWDVLQMPSFFIFTGQPNLLLELGISIFFQGILLFYFAKKHKWQFSHF